MSFTVLASLAGIGFVLIGVAVNLICVRAGLPLPTSGKNQPARGRRARRRQVRRGVPTRRRSRARPGCGPVAVGRQRVELGVWRDSASAFVDTSRDDAIGVLHRLQAVIDERLHWLDRQPGVRRKIARTDGQRVQVVVCDEYAFYTTTGDRKQVRNSRPRSPTWWRAAGRSASWRSWQRRSRTAT